MGQNSEFSPKVSSVQSAAATWIARREAGLTAREQQELKAWLAADDAHRTALAEADPHRTEVDWAFHAGAAEEVLAGLSQLATRRRRRRRMLAGTAAAALLMAGLFWTTAQTARPLPVSESVSVKTVQPRRLELPDGSIVELRHGAAITHDFSGPSRWVTLLHGTAHFQVAHDKARPFLVSTSGVDVRAVGTAFSVHSDTKDVEIVVTEGRVAVVATASAVSPRSPPGAVPANSLLLAAGQGIIVDVTAPESSFSRVRPLNAATLPARLAWRVPRLEFAGTPLAEVVAVMNRHNQIQFVLADAELGRLQLSGVVSADKVEALQEMLEAAFALRAERNGNQIKLRRAR
jgi:transmembrane sensor